jgi:hypothetical protein
VLVTTLAYLSAVHAADDPLDQLMRELAQRPHGHAAFTEQQFMSILKRPLESSGELIYDAPDRLEKRTIRPHAETMLLAHGVLTVSRDAHTYRVSLRDHPELAPFVDSIRAMLAGDRAALERTYEIDFAPAADGWTLTLVPRDKTLRAVIARVRIAGSAALIRSFEFIRGDGDRSLLSITPLEDP